jgi:hypothetical protein
LHPLSISMFNLSTAPLRRTDSGSRISICVEQSRFRRRIGTSVGPGKPRSLNGIHEGRRQLHVGTDAGFRLPRYRHHVCRPSSCFGPVNAQTLMQARGVWNSLVSWRASGLKPEHPRPCAAQLSSVLIVRLAPADSHGADHRAQNMQIRPDFRGAYGGVLYWWRATYPEDLGSQDRATCVAALCCNTRPTH